MLRGILTALFLLAAAAAQACPIPGDSLFASPFETSSGVFRYVAATAPNNAGDGSFAQPWRTVQYAATHVAAGDTVCVRGGIYNEVVTPTSFGSPTSGVVTLRNFPNETPVIDGTGLSVPNGQGGLITLVNPHDIVVRGFEVRNLITASTALVPIGIYVTGAGGNITIVGNRVHDIRNTGNGCAANAFGIKVDGTQAPASIHDLVLSGNEVDHLVLGCSESFSLDGNVEHWRIDHNTVHDTNNIGIGAIGFEGVAPDPAYDQARDGEISDNLVYNISSFGNPAYGNQYAADGIYVDGGTRILIDRNRVHHVDIGIEMASEHATRTTSASIVRNNLVYLCNSVGISLGGYDASVGGTTSVDVIGNTLFHNDTTQGGGGELQIQYHATSNRFFNNLVFAGAQGVMLYSYVTGADPAELDYNLYYSTLGGNSTFTWKNTAYTGFASYRIGSQHEFHSLFDNPLLVDTATPDLHTGTNSPAVGHASNLGSPTVGALDADGKARIQGNAIDMGAYER